MAGAVALCAVPAAAQEASGQGVTPTSIKFVVTFPDVAAIRQIINVDPGNYQVAYQSLFNQTTPRAVSTDARSCPSTPWSPRSGRPAGHRVHAAHRSRQGLRRPELLPGPRRGLLRPDPRRSHSRRVAQRRPGAQAKAPWFNNLISDSDLVPEEMATFAKQGVFTGKKDGVVGTSVDQAELNQVVSAPKADKANVVQTAVNSVPGTDTAAQIQEYGVIAQKFQSSRVDLVVAVGDAGNGWPSALQRTRAPTRRNSSPPTTTTCTPSWQQGGLQPRHPQGRADCGRRRAGVGGWNDPAMKRCVATVHKADRAPPSTSGDGDGVDAGDLNAPATACTQVALLRHRQGSRQDAEQPDFRQGRRVPHARHDPRWGGSYDFSGVTTTATARLRLHLEPDRARARPEVDPQAQRVGTHILTRPCDPLTPGSRMGGMIRWGASAPPDPVDRSGGAGACAASGPHRCSRFVFVVVVVGACTIGDRS